LFEPERGQQQQQQQQLSDSLLGEREHGLPPVVSAAKSGGRVNASDVSDDGAVIDIPDVLASMREINELQLIRHEDKFGSVTSNTTIIAIQVIIEAAKAMIQ